MAKNGKLLSVFYLFRVFFGNIVDFGGISRIFHALKGRCSTS
jgi:hypothetical protein